VYRPATDAIDWFYGMTTSRGAMKAFSQIDGNSDSTSHKPAGFRENKFWFWKNKYLSATKGSLEMVSEGLNTDSMFILIA
jgi:hypothetical protein